MRIEILLACVIAATAQAASAQVVWVPETKDRANIKDADVTGPVSGPQHLTTAPGGKQTTRKSVQIISGGNSTDGAAKRSRLPILD